MVTRDEVEGAYRYLLNRPPEGEAAIERHRNGAADFAALRARFLAAPEFFRANGREILRYVVAGEMPRTQADVESECTPEQLALVFAHVQEVWSRLPSMWRTTLPTWRGSTIRNCTRCRSRVCSPRLRQRAATSCRATGTTRCQA